jgi:hypothetical protein
LIKILIKKRNTAIKIEDIKFFIKLTLQDIIVPFSKNRIKRVIKKENIKAKKTFLKYSFLSFNFLRLK